MRRTVLAAVAVGIAFIPLAAQQKTPKACAIYVNIEAGGITDPSPVVCEQGGDVGVVFCNHTGAKLSATLSKTMKYNSSPVDVLQKDITQKNIPDGGCRLGMSKVLASATPHSKPPYMYTVTAGALKLDPDMDVAPPSGVLVPPARGAAPAGRGGRQ